MADDLLVSGSARLQICLRGGQSGERLGGRASAWATSVRVTSPTSKRSLVALSCSLSTVTSFSRNFTMAVSRTTIDVSGGGVEQHGLLDGAQALARGLNCRLSPSNGIQVLKTFEQRLCERESIAVGVAGAVTGYDISPPVVESITAREELPLFRDTGEVGLEF